MKLAQVPRRQKNGACNFFGSGGAAERNSPWIAIFWAGLSFPHRFGHVRVNPAGCDAIYEEILWRSELGGRPFREADDAAFAGAVVRVKGFAALSGGGADGNDLAGLLLIICGTAKWMTE